MSRPSRSVLFVCSGNICRSPAAEAVLRAMLPGSSLLIGSAAIGDWHIGSPAHPRSIAVDARGAGFFRALEVQDKSLVDPVRNATRANGVIVRSDVRVNPCLAISPPLISTKAHVDELCEALGKGLAAVAGA